ncbi:CHAP domain-containing protein [Streptomyces sp. WAC 06783]|uniref:CHAP domain-containing protein n=1 Tax=Streptomyces sp. WAC 06783 TaxID=2203211 RepID=UPI00163B97F9|nr:CHAP domain-containing protein [Streptomyces sp. WAC 06783]
MAAPLRPVESSAVPAETATTVTGVRTAQTGSCGRNGTEAHAWCADFVGWVWWKNGDGGKMHKLDDLASSVTKYAPTHFKPKAGDAILYNQHTPTVADDHVAIVVRISGSKITVVGGNQGTPGSVSTRTWSSYKVGSWVNSAQKISGYVTPAAGWPGAGGPPRSRSGGPPASARPASS